MAKSTKYTLSIHNKTIENQHDLIVNTKFFPNIKMGDILEIIRCDDEDIRCILQVSSLDCPHDNIQISMLNSIADVFQFFPRNNIIIEIRRQEELLLEFVELSFIDKYISRGEMKRFIDNLRKNSQCIYLGKQLKAMSFMAQVDMMIVKGEQVTCGVLGPFTKIVYRSRSCRCYWFIEISFEMWQSADDGQLYFEKVLAFFKQLFNHYHQKKYNHFISIILYSRTYFVKDSTMPDFSSHYNDVNSPSLSFNPLYENFNELSDDIIKKMPIDHKGRHYQDFYQVLIDDKDLSDLPSFLSLLSSSLLSFPSHIYWGYNSPEHYRGIPCFSSEVNFLQSINLSLNVFDHHYIDRDLERTGQSIFVITAGSGVYQVNKTLSDLTKDRIIDNGIGVDILSVNCPALHFTPLFIYQDIHTNNDKMKDYESSIYELPCWINYKYYNVPSILSHSSSLFTPFPYGRVREYNITETLHLLLSNSSPSSSSSLTDHSSQPHIKHSISYKPFENQSHLSYINPVDLVRYDNEVFTNPLDKRSNSSPDLLALSLQIQDEPFYLSSSTQSYNAHIYSSYSYPHISSIFNSSSSSHDDKIKRDKERRDSLASSDSNTTTKIDNPQNSKFDISHRSFIWSKDGTNALRVTLETNIPSYPLLSPQPDIISNVNKNTSNIKSKGHSLPSLSPFHLSSKSQCSHNPDDMTSHRWSHLFPTLKSLRKPYDVDWKSILTPSILPLRTDDYIETSELNKYNHYFHSLPLISQKKEDLVKKIDRVMEELIGQRLAQDFQLVDRLEEIYPPSHLRVILSSSSEVHHLYADYDMGNIEVKRYILKDQYKSDETEIKYPYYIWSNHLQSWLPQQATLSHHHLNYNWNYLDHLLCDFHQNLYSNLKYRNVHFAIIPDIFTSDSNEKTKEKNIIYEERTNSFTKFMETLNILLPIISSQPLISPSNPSNDQLYQKIVLNSSWKDRYEWLMISYDKYYYVNHVYHLEIQWLFSSGNTISDYLNNISRKAKSSKIKLIQLPHFSLTHPFHHPLLISIPSSLHHHVIQYLMDSKEYIADHDNTFLHYSGSFLIAKKENGFLTTNNILPSYLEQRESNKLLLRQFSQFCHHLTICYNCVLKIIDNTSLATNSTKPNNLI